MEEIGVYGRPSLILSITSSELEKLKNIVNLDLDFKNKSQLKELFNILESMSVEAIRNNMIEEELSHIANTIRYLRIIAEGYVKEAKTNAD